MIEEGLLKGIARVCIPAMEVVGDSVKATHTHEGDTVAAVVDRRVPDRSDDQEQPRWTSLPFKNRGENIIFEFDHPRTVGSIAIYWYAESGGEGEKIRLPRNWWVEYREGDADWTRMKKYVTDDYSLERDIFNVVRPGAPLKCDAVSIRILPQVGFCMGVHEIQLQFDE